MFVESAPRVMRARGPWASFKGVKTFLRGLEALPKVFKVLRNNMTVQRHKKVYIYYQVLSLE